MFGFATPGFRLSTPCTVYSINSTLVSTDSRIQAIASSKFQLAIGKTCENPEVAELCYRTDEPSIDMW